ncbi:uncharacterized protein LOC116603473 [Nematostella vectensis]|uniref:uncharacterized protein LOC116603473 n=1 Tax=Nematostella vectensis TaxID=45351 RepID=UPI0013902CC0|nr:uncharacterized protein LOC116603473 [Nematostella vectensis]
MRLKFDRSELEIVMNGFSCSENNNESNDNLEIATAAFQHAKTYDRVREHFSLRSALLVLSKLGILDENGQACYEGEEQITVLEVAAGTGKFTEVLVQALKDTNIRLIASEPLESMGRVFQENYPDVEFISCASEEIPLPDSSVHCIVAANASHFISNAESYAEMSRVLVPGGGLGYVNLLLDAEVIPWCVEFYKLSVACYQQTGLYQKLDEYAVDVGWKEELDNSGKFSKICEDRSDQFLEETTEEDELECLMSYGAFSTCEREERMRIRDKLRDILWQNYSGVGKTLNSIPLRSIIFYTKKL